MWAVTAASYCPSRAGKLPKTFPKTSLHDGTGNSVKASQNPALLPSLVDNDEEAEGVDDLLVVGEDVDGVADLAPSLAHLLPQEGEHGHLDGHAHYHSGC